jgi:hypothetical protein
MQFIPYRRTVKLSVCINKHIFRLSPHNNFFDKKNFSSRPFFMIVRDSPQGARASSFTRFLDHTQRRSRSGRTPLDELSARRRNLYLTTHNNHNRQESIHPVRFETTISACERPQTPHLRSRGHWDRHSLTLEN